MQSSNKLSLKCIPEIQTPNVGISSKIVKLELVIYCWKSNKNSFSYIYSNEGSDNNDPPTESPKGISERLEVKLHPKIQLLNMCFLSEGQVGTYKIALETND